MSLYIAVRKCEKAGGYLYIFFIIGINQPQALSDYKPQPTVSASSNRKLHQLSSALVTNRSHEKVGDLH